MPYFPRDEERIYTCPGCGNRIGKGNGWMCCVLHAPGTCCHVGETVLGPAHPKDLPKHEEKHDD